MRKPITSPCAPQPKQWKKALSSLTLKEGVFSLWNGHSPRCSRPRRCSRTRRPTTEDRLSRALSSSKNEGGNDNPFGPLRPSWLDQDRRSLTRALALEKSICPAGRWFRASSLRPRSSFHTPPSL